MAPFEPKRVARSLRNSHSEIEDAIKIQKECLELKPQSFYPYYQYGYILLDQSRFKEAIPYLTTAYKIENQRDIIHNIGYCNFQLQEFQKAKECFLQAITELDLENRSLFNLALTEWNLGSKKKVKPIANKLFKDIESNVHKTVSGYEIGLLYFLLDDFQKTTECLLKQGIEGIDLIDWKELSYSLYQIDKNLWEEKINLRIEEYIEWIEQIKNNHDDWSEYNNQEKQEYLTDFQQEIQTRRNILQNGMMKPKPKIKKSLLIEYCGCLLFDCKRHGNAKDD